MVALRCVVLCCVEWLLGSSFPLRPAPNEALLLLPPHPFGVGSPMDLFLYPWAALLNEKGRVLCVCLFFILQAEPIS